MKIYLELLYKAPKLLGLVPNIGPKILSLKNCKIYVTKITCGNTSFGRLEKWGTATTYSPWAVLIKHSCKHKDTQKEHVHYNFLEENSQTATENNKILGYSSKT